MLSSSIRVTVARSTLAFKSVFRSKYTQFVNLSAVRHSLCRYGSTICYSVSEEIIPDSFARSSKWRAAVHHTTGLPSNIRTSSSTSPISSQHPCSQGRENPQRFDEPCSIFERTESFIRSSTLRSLPVEPSDSSNL